MTPQSHVNMYWNSDLITVREVPTDREDTSVFELDQPGKKTSITIAIPPCRDGVFAHISRGKEKLGQLTFDDGFVRVRNANDQDVDSFLLGELSLTRRDLALEVVPNRDEFLVPRVSAAMLGAAILAHQRQHVMMSA